MKRLKYPGIYLVPLLLMALAFGLAPGRNLVVNGDFEQALSVGWNIERGGTGTKTTERRPWSHPDTGHYCFVRQYGGGGFAKIWQLIDVDGPDLEFSYYASWAIGNGSPTCWPVASVILEYFDHRGLWTGETRWYRHDAYCNWRSANNRNLISITDPGWNRYTLNIRQEIENNLPAVNPETVRRVGITLYCYTSSG